MRPLLLRARTVVPDPASALDDGAVLVHGDRVARVGRFRGDLDREPARVTDLGEVALLPGLVNAHAHLDLTGARGRMRPGSDFLEWILRIRPLREELRPTVAAAAEEGARELLAGGCTLVADTVAEPEALEGLRRSGIRAVACMEVIAFPSREVRPLRDALGALDRLPAGGSLRPGLAPHTPYTCSPETLARCAEAARTRRLPLSIHLGETRHEVDWLRTGEGPFAAILREFWGEAARPFGRGPVEHLEALGLFREPRLVAHGNFLEPGERETLRDSGSVVAHCPGSHAFFGHGAHPVADLRRAGVPVAVGTDGLVCHPDHALSIPGELRRLAAREPSLSPRELLAMATTAGAEGLGMAGLAGVLAPGSYADAAAFAVPGGWKGAESLLDPDLRCTASFVGGVLRHQETGRIPRA